MRFFLFLAIVLALCLLGYRVYTYQPPPEPHLAPPGVFFLTHYVSAQTPTGVIGLAPGEEVKLVNGKTAPGTRLVTEGSRQFEVQAGYLTNDIDLAANLRSTDTERQKSAARQLAIEKQAADRAKRKLEIEMAKRAQEDLARRPAASTPTSILDAPPRR